MNTTSKAVRRGLYAVFAASAAGGAMVAAMAVPSATAAPDPCAASRGRKDHRLGGHLDGQLPRLAP